MLLIGTSSVFRSEGGGKRSGASGVELGAVTLESAATPESSAALGTQDSAFACPTFESSILPEADGGRARCIVTISIALIVRRLPSGSRGMRLDQRTHPGSCLAPILRA